MADGLSCDPSDLPGYIPWVTVSPTEQAIHIGLVVSPSHSVHISHVVGGQKRSREELDSNDMAEPALKRPALSMGPDDVNSQDIDMGATEICLSPPGKFCSSSPGQFHVIDPPSLSLWGKDDDDDDDIWRLIGWSTVEDHIKESLCKETGGSYWYRMPSNEQGSPSPSTFRGKSIQDMRLRPDKTFFHINEMIYAKKNRYFGSDSVFELFARVVHTGCGGFNIQSFQCFKLEDLFPGQPYMSGIMMFKRKESPIYCESSPFLTATKTVDDLCYCLCEVVEDEKSRLGWSLLIYDIQPVTWEIVRSAHSNLGKRV